MSRPWANAYRIGLRGEALAKELLLPRLFPGAQIVPVEVAADQKWLHSDFIVYHGKEKHFVEVKYDIHASGNIAAETHTHYLASGLVTPGWLYKSKADYVLYILAAFRKAYLIDLAQLRLLVAQNDFRLAKTNVQGKYEPYFYLVPSRVLDEHGVRSIAYEEVQIDAQRVPGTRP